MFAFQKRAKFSHVRAALVILVRFSLRWDFSSSSSAFASPFDPFAVSALRNLNLEFLFLLPLLLPAAPAADRVRTRRMRMTPDRHNMSLSREEAVVEV